MATKNQKYTDNVGGGYPGKEKPATVKINFNMSSERNSGLGDALKQSLGHRDAYQPSGMHSFTHSKTPKAVGARYEPRGEFGLSTKTIRKGTDYKPHTSRPGQNAVGNNSNRKGDNPLGRALGRKGSNAVGNNLNRKGTNAIGSKMPARGTFHGNA